MAYVKVVAVGFSLFSYFLAVRNCGNGCSIVVLDSVGLLRPRLWKRKKSLCIKVLLQYNNRPPGMKFRFIITVRDLEDGPWSLLLTP